jgi:phenylacetate-coenzyme A ligase PaaK-like adenylate-forming protein
MASWDRRTPEAQAKLRDTRLREQLRDGIAPFSPFWRDRFSALKVPARSINGAADLPKLPAVGERDVCPDGNPADAARLVLQADEAGFALHAEGPALRKAIATRLRGAAAYKRQVEAAVRPTTYHWAGSAFRFPVASTRSDLDLIARAGARAWGVLGLTGEDVLVSAVPVAQQLEHQFLSLAALGAGAPALFPREYGEGVARVAAAVGLVRPTVLAVPVAGAAELVADLAGAGADLTTVKRVLVLGPITASDRADLEEALESSGVSGATVLALYGPPEGRLMWAECAPGSGFHTYPDLDLVEVVDPETAEPADTGELVLTQLGFRGSALLRWRTGDVVGEPLATGACPCGRTVPRIPATVQAGPFVRLMRPRGGDEAKVDLRAVAGALTGRPDVSDWRIELRRSARDGSDELVVFVVPQGDESDAAVNVYRDVRAVSGFTASQVVVAQPAELAALAASAEAVSPRISVRA